MLSGNEYTSVHLLSVYQVFSAREYDYLLCHAFNCSVNHKQAHAPILLGYIRTALYRLDINAITNVRMWKCSSKSQTEKYSDKWVEYTDSFSEETSLFPAGTSANRSISAPVHSRKDALKLSALEVLLKENYHS